MGAATWALEHDMSVVIANGFADQTIRNIVMGKKIGTFFTTLKEKGDPIELQASKGE